MHVARLALLCVSLGTLVAAAATPVDEGTASTGAPEPGVEAVIAELPFQASAEPNRIYVDLAPEGHRPLVMLLETGGNDSVFSPRAARAVGVSIRRAKSTPYRRATRLGRDLQFYVDTRRSDTGARTGWAYGLLGGNFLERYVVELDFRGRRVRFLDPKQYRVPEAVEAPDEVVIPIRRVGRRISVEIEMNGRSLEVLLDTGAPYPLTLSGNTAEKLGVEVTSLPDFGFIGTVLGRTSVKLHETNSFRFASFEFDRMPVVIAPRGTYNLGVSTESVLGYDALSQFTVRIDYPRQRMWLRREDSTVTFMGVDYALLREAGVLVQPVGDTYGVLAVLPDTPASSLGLRPGDVLMQVVGRDEASLEETRKRIARGDKILVSRRGENDAWVDVSLPAGEGDAPMAMPVNPKQERERAEGATAE